MPRLVQLERCFAVAAANGLTENCLLVALESLVVWAAWIWLWNARWSVSFIGSTPFKLRVALRFSLAENPAARFGLDCWINGQARILNRQLKALKHYSWEHREVFLGFNQYHAWLVGSLTRRSFDRQSNRPNSFSLNTFLALRSKSFHSKRWITWLVGRWRTQPTAWINVNCRHIEHRHFERTLRKWVFPTSTTVWGWQKRQHIVYSYTSESGVVSGEKHALGRYCLSGNTDLEEDWQLREWPAVPLS